MSVRGVKCVGGPYDGKMFSLEHWRTHVDVPSIVDAWPPLDCAEILSEPVSVTHTCYTLRTLHSLGDEYFEFLTPDDWSILQALRHQFSK